MNSYDNSFAKGSYHYRGMTAIMLRIKQSIGWQSFIDTFHDMKNLTLEELDYIYAMQRPDDIGKFNLFLTKLNKNSSPNIDVFNLLNSNEKNIIQSKYGGTITTYIAPPPNIGGSGQVNINLPAGAHAIRRFIPLTSGSYNIFTVPYAGSGPDNDTVIEIYADDYLSILLSSNNDYGGSKFSKVTMNLQANQTYFIKVKNNTISNIVHADLKISKAPVTLTLSSFTDTTVSGLEISIIKFTPTTAGQYVFTSGPHGGVSQLSNKDSILELFKDEALTKRDSASQYKTGNFPQLSAMLTGNQTYYLTYSGYIGKTAMARLKVTQPLTTISSISNMQYNNGIGPISGGNNLLKFSINRNVTTSASYYIVPYLSWDNIVFYEKSDNYIFVSLSGASTPVIINNISLDNNSNNILYSKIRIYSNATDKVLLWEGPNPAIPIQKSLETHKTLQLDNNYCGNINANTSEGIVRYYIGTIPANKIVVVSLAPTILTDKTGDMYRKGMSLKDSNNVSINPSESQYEKTVMTYYKIVKTDTYSILISNNTSVTKSYTLNVYTTDYIIDSKAFIKRDSLNLNSGSLNNYLIFNAPEHLESQNQLGDKKRYISKMPINGNANIYWEHLNLFKKTMTYGILLHNITSTNITVTINKKSAYSKADENVIINNFYAPLEIWNDYNYNIIKNDLTTITNLNKTISIGANSSSWIFLKNIPTSINGLFNGVINLTINGNNTLMCYSFLMENKNQIEYDFNINGLSGGHQNYLSYIRAEGGEGHLSGTTNGPVLSSNLGTIDLSNMKKYSVIITGYDVPIINSGESMPLYYDGIVTKKISPNYAVIYKFNINSIVGNNNAKAVFEFNQCINPNFLDDPDSGIYVTYCIYQSGNINDTKSAVLLQPKYTGYSTKLFTKNTLPTGSFTIDVIVSGMSSLPLLLTFE